MSLDTLVMETTRRLVTAGREVSPMAAKAAIQLARHLVVVDEELAGEQFLEQVALRLRRQRVLLSAECVGDILGTYARLVVEMEITETCEIG